MIISNDKTCEKHEGEAILPRCYSCIAEKEREQERRQMKEYLKKTVVGHIVDELFEDYDQGEARK